MTLHDYAAAIRKHWIVILILGALGAALGFTASQFMPDQYRSQASVMVVATGGESTSDLVQGANYVQSLVTTYTILASSPVVLQPVVESLELDETPTDLAKRVDVSAPVGSAVLTIGVTDGDPARAKLIADTIADKLAEAVKRLAPAVKSTTVTGVTREPAVRIATIAPARVPEARIAPRTTLNVVIGGVAGLGVGLIYALLRRRFGAKLVSPSDIADVTDTPVIGEIGRSQDGLSIAATMRAAPDGRIAEAMRQVTASLKFLGIDEDRRVIMLTSPSAGEGKSSVAMGLALTMAEMDHRVLYIEADLRRPSASRYTQLEDSVGLTTVLLGEATLTEAVQNWAHPNLSVLTSGVLPPNPGQVMSSGQLQAVVDEARELFEYVIIDTAPVLSVSDAQWLVPLVDGTLLAARANRTKRQELRRALTLLNSGTQDVLGIVLNDTKRFDRSPYYSEDPRSRSGRVEQGTRNLR